MYIGGRSLYGYYQNYYFRNISNKYIIFVSNVAGNNIFKLLFSKYFQIGTEFLRFYRLNSIIFCCNLFQTVNMVNMFHGISCFLVIPHRLVIYFDYASRSTMDQSEVWVGRINIFRWMQYLLDNLIICYYGVI